MPEKTRKRLGERLVAAQLISDEQLQSALVKHKETHSSLKHLLVELGFITEERLLAFMGESLGIFFIDDIFSKITDPEVVRLLPEKTCRQYLAIPLCRDQGVLTIAMGDPLDVFAVDDLQQIAKCKIQPVLGRKDDIVQAIEKFFEDKEQLDEIAQDMAQEAEELEIVRESKEAVGEEEAVEVDAPIIRLVNTVITQAIKERASDIHIEPDEKSLRIRYRIDGVLRETMTPPKRLQAPIISRIKVMSAMDISIKRTPQDGRFKIRVDNKDFDMRISSVPTIYGEKLVLRILDQSIIKMGLEDSGFNPECFSVFKEMIHRPYGIILVSGPTGSGKTTTLYLALQSINSPDKNVITIEEPVEYDLEGINQIAVNVKAGVTFASGLRSVLRQDPDVIMVGEMRDLETADVAVRAALTGHLVFSTIHTNDAPSSIARMIDMGVPPYLVTSSISCVLAQRLVRMICVKCKEPYQPSPEVLVEAGLDGSPHDYTFYEGRGCEECRHTGYRGRTGIFELMVVDKEVRALIHAGESGDKIREAAQRGGMKALWQDGLEKVVRGITTLKELQRVSFLEQEG